VGGDGDSGNEPLGAVSGSAATGGGPRPLLLAVGSDSRMARALERQLQRGFASRGFAAAGTTEASAALDRLRDLRDRGEPVALLIADQHLSEVAGLELLKEGRRLHPDARTVLLIPHRDLTIAIDAVDTAGLDHFLVKPFHGERDLLPIASDLIESWEGARDRDAAAVRVVGEPNSEHVHRIRRFLERNQIHYRWLDAGWSEAGALLEALPEPDRARLPVVLFPDGVALAEPSNRELAGRLGLATRPSLTRYDLVVVGAGPAGLAAAVYGSSEGLGTVMIDREAPGGQAGQSPRIDNYLGFHAGLSGSELARRAIIQVRRFGAEIVRPSEVVGLEAAGEDRLIRLSDGTTVSTRCVLVATGVSYRRLAAPGVAELVGAGIYYGTSPGDARDRVDQNVVVVGGANSAGQAALEFARFARKVTIVVRAGSLAERMSRYLVDRIEAEDKIEVLTRTELAAAHGSERLAAVTLARDGEVGAEPIPVDAVFIFIGALPHTDWLAGALARDDHGFIVSGRDLGLGGRRPTDWPLDRDPYPLESSMPGVFVAGDVRHGSIKRVASAVGEGAMAVQLIHQYLAGPA
jgi:thioredoxin reductase (NADPH)